MPYQGFPDGLYLVKQKSNIKPNLIDHYGVIDIGNTLSHPQGNPYMSIVIHQAIPAIRVDWLSSTTGTWDVMGKVLDDQILNAKKRIHEALRNPLYDLFGNNCEHFARYVTTGLKESKQLQNAVAVVALGSLLISLWNVVDNE